MDKQDLAIGIAVLAFVLAIFAIVIMPQPSQLPAGITYDPVKQPSVLPLREPTSASAEIASGILIDGQQINATVTTSSPTVGQVVTLSGSTWVVITPGSASPGSKVGMVVKAPTSNSSRNGQVLLEGLVYKSGWSMTKGNVYYADDVTPGAITVNKNATYLIPVGYAYNTSVLLFNPVINATANGM